MTCRPLGFKSANRGVRAPTRVKSSSSSFTFAECAMASRCSTAFVEPPIAITSAMALRNASRVRMSEGRMPRRIKCNTARPASRQSRVLAAEMAFCAPLFVRLMPSASMAEAIVLAVYIPPHDPAPGIAQPSMSRSSLSEISPRACFPTASNTLTMSTGWPWWQPGLMVPP